MLTQKQIDQYRSDGFVLCRGLIGDADLERYNKRFVEIASGETEPTEGMTVMRDVMVVKGAVEAETPVHAVNKIMNLEHDETLYSYALHPAVLDIARTLIGADLYSLTTNAFNKPPKVDGRHPLHQDLRYFRIRPARHIVGVWTALLPTTRDNGCLCVIPGTHEGELLKHTSPDWEYVNHAFFGVDVDRGERVHVEMAPGDTLFFHPLLVHGSGSNKTDAFRRAISVHYASDACFADQGEWRTGVNVRRIDSKR